MPSARLVTFIAFPCISLARCAVPGRFRAHFRSKKNLKLQCEPTKFDQELVKFYCGISETLLEYTKPSLGFNRTSLNFHCRKGLECPFAHLVTFIAFPCISLAPRTVPGRIRTCFRPKNLKLHCESTKFDQKLVKFYCGIRRFLLRIHKT